MNFLPHMTAQVLRHFDYVPNFIVKGVETGTEIFKIQIEKTLEIARSQYWTKTEPSSLLQTLNHKIVEWKDTANEIYKYYFSKTEKLKKINRSTLLFIGTLSYATVFGDKRVLATTPLAGLCLSMDLYTLINDWTVNKLTKDQSKQNVVVVWIDAKSTGFFSKDITILREFSKTHSIVCIDIKDIPHLNQGLDDILKTGKNITTLWIKTHGNPRAIKMANSIIDRQSIKNIHFDKLDEGANIVLASCSVGFTIDLEPNIAECTQVCAGPSRQVNATKNFLWYGCTYCTNADQGVKAKWNFKGFFGSDITATISYAEAVSKVEKYINKV